MTPNPVRILHTLDRHLRHPFTLHIYGRSALALGYPNAPAEMQATMDVDAILPTRDVLKIDANDDFWRAQELTNTELGDTGLYFTHLFEEPQVILTPNWLDRIVRIEIAGLSRLALFRPATEDLVLTKMMRIDPQDREDIAFLLDQTDYRTERMIEALSEARIPPVTEIQEAFETNKAWISDLL